MGVKLVTGKTHQIRVHMQALGEELGFKYVGIVGDFQYATKEAFNDLVNVNNHGRHWKPIVDRVFLHMETLGWRDLKDTDNHRSQTADMSRELWYCIRDGYRKKARLTTRSKRNAALREYRRKNNKLTKLDRFVDAFWIGIIYYFFHRPISYSYIVGKNKIFFTDSIG